MDLVNRLQEENRRFKQNDSSKLYNESDGKTVPKCQTDTSNLLNESDFQKLKRLRGQMEKQRDELMCRDQEIEEKNTEIENVSSLNIFLSFGNLINSKMIDFYSFQYNWNG